MAEGRVFVCSSCAHAITAWDDGDPYYLDEQGEKRYAHHPDPARDRCVGIDESMLCLSCGAECMRDSRAPINACTQCASQTLIATWELDGVPCPRCKRGTYHIDPTSQMIS